MPHSCKLYLLALGAVLLSGPAASAQESVAFGSNSALNAAQSYAFGSSHILIGNTGSRKTEQAGIGYAHKLIRWTNLVMSYEGWVMPLYIEADPTYVASSTPDVYNGGPPTIQSFASPYRPLYVGQTLGYVRAPVNPGHPDPLLPIIGITGPDEHTYAFAALPIGFRLSALTHHRIQPSFAIDLGALYATRNIPVDYTSNFNFLAQAGPGVEIFFNKHRSARIEYLYLHLSNADTGTTNPGIDSLAFRFTLSRYRDH